VHKLRYLTGVASLQLDAAACLGCGLCQTVCPHGVFVVENRQARIVEADGCMECGACAMNCPANAISVKPGVGCAAYIIRTWLKGKGCSGGAGECC